MVNQPHPLTGTIIPTADDTLSDPDPLTGIVTPATAEKPAPPDLPATVKELRAYAKQLGLPAGGNKTTLIKRIADHLAAGGDEHEGEEHAT